jgi:hypothetical protein
MAFQDLLLELSLSMVQPAADDTQPADDAQPAADSQPADDAQPAADDQPADDAQPAAADDAAADAAADDQPADDDSQPTAADDAADDAQPAAAADDSDDDANDSDDDDGDGVWVENFADGNCHCQTRCECKNPDCIEIRELVNAILNFIKDNLSLLNENIDRSNVNVDDSEYRLRLHTKEINVYDDDGYGDIIECNEDNFKDYTIKVSGYKIFRNWNEQSNRQSIIYKINNLSIVIAYDIGDYWWDSTIATFSNFDDFCAGFPKLNLGELEPLTKPNLINVLGRFEPKLLSMGIDLQTLLRND